MPEGQKRTKKEIKNILEKMGYLLIKEYISKEDNYIRKVVIKDSFGYMYDVNLVNILKGQGVNITHISNPYSLKNISTWLKLNNKNFKLSKDNTYLNAKKDKLKFYCLSCKDYFYSGWDSVYQGHGCGLCKGFQIGRFNSLEYLRPDLMKEWNYESNIFLPNSISISSNKKADWICSICKAKWNSSINKRTFRGDGCPVCKASSNEQAIRKLFIFWGMVEGKDFHREYRFKDCRNIIPLPFDFCIMKNKKDILFLCEFQGEQHRKVLRNNYFGGEIELKERQRRDKIKFDYCEKNKIPLIIIPDTESKNIEKLLVNAFEKLEG